MELIWQEENSKLIVELPERVDALNAQEFEEAFVELLNKQKADIAISFTNLNYVSSAGLRVFLLVAKKQQEEGRKLVIFAMQPFIKEIFEMTGFLNLFSLVESKEDALKQLEN